MSADVKYDLRSDEFRENPYPTWAAMREQDPVWFNPDFGMYFLTRHADVKALTNADRFSVERLEAVFSTVSPAVAQRRDEVLSFMNSWMSMVDAPRHTMLRGAVAKAFTPKAVRQLREFAQGIVDRRIAAVRERGECDLVADIARPIPCEMLAHMCAMPLEDFDKFVDWSDAMVHVISQPVDLDGAMIRAHEAVVAMKEYFAGPIAEYQRNPRDDFFSELVNAEFDGGRLTFEELVSSLSMLLVGGNETTRKLIGNAVVALGEHPDQLALLREQPDLMTEAIEEFIRYDGVAVQLLRITRQDIDFGDAVVPAGSVVFGAVHAANRDPAMFVEPDRLDVRRSGLRGHVAFGAGPHFCVGAALGRMETEVALNGILAGLPDLEISTDHLDWEVSAMHRSVEALPIRFTPSAAAATA